MQTPQQDGPRFSLTARFEEETTRMSFYPDDHVPPPPPGASKAPLRAWNAQATHTAPTSNHNQLETALRSLLRIEPI